MNVVVNDEGFQPDDWTDGFVTLDDAANDVVALDVPSDTDPDDLSERLGNAQMVRVDFPSFADGRGFTIARTLRLKGYTGRLRAKGHVLADQYAMARRAGFDEVEIDGILAERQPEDQWVARADWKAHNYQARLRG
ncbi:oxidoreductase [Phaeobacter gallaeciensis]|uniref:Oxidoreductase n=2 Tax=Roseobacteraceae TaxID=2854170 RepID=A0A366WRG5_9RHOB|nr:MULTISPECIES: DUF934 domain-containing protein [Roseobacteraceae]MBT3140881.1 DUF934 domain-containing protein [Falsiruegeria litorea]MBT8170625.1 DUF934 domain-containing protein [Falsiruegeria litorea]RBW52828.1 oxidoreductase [Phaeobacter gallaeciensis]